MKRTCPNCETRFYDLQREPIVCPECGATYDVDEHGKVSATRERRVQVPAAAPKTRRTLVDDEDSSRRATRTRTSRCSQTTTRRRTSRQPGADDEEEGEDADTALKDAGLIDDDENDEDVEDLEEDSDDDGDLESARVRAGERRRNRLIPRNPPLGSARRQVGP